MPDEQTARVPCPRCGTPAVAALHDRGDYQEIALRTRVCARALTDNELADMLDEAGELLLGDEW